VAPEARSFNRLAPSAATPQDKSGPLRASSGSSCLLPSLCRSVSCPAATPASSSVASSASSSSFVPASVASASDFGDGRVQLRPVNSSAASVAASSPSAAASSSFAAGSKRAVPCPLPSCQVRPREASQRRLTTEGLALAAVD